MGLLQALGLTPMKDVAARLADARDLDARFTGEPPDAATPPAAPPNVGAKAGKGATAAPGQPGAIDAMNDALAGRKLATDKAYSQQDVIDYSLVLNEVTALIAGLNGHAERASIAAAITNAQARLAQAGAKAKAGDFTAA